MHSDTALIADRYRLERLLGEGAMATVHHAVDTALNRPVALKIMRPEVAPHAARFDREARAAAGLGHPAVVGVHDFGLLEDKRPYLALEFIEGTPFDDLIEAAGPLDAPEAVMHLKPVAGALAEAHRRGVVHRDLKPANLMLQRPEGMPAMLRVLDFGIARMAGISDDQKLTGTGIVFGTPAFMAPEQALGRKVDARADVWAFGGVLFYALTGDVPFKEPDVPALLNRIVRGEPDPLPDSVPDSLRALVERCLAREPDDRFADGAALVEALSALRFAAMSIGAPTMPDHPVVPAAPEPVTEVVAAPARPVGEATDLVAAQSPARKRPDLPWLAGLTIVGLVLGIGIGVGIGSSADPASGGPAVGASAGSTAEALPAAIEQPAPAPELAPAQTLLDQNQHKAALAWLEAHTDAGSPDARLSLLGQARLGTGAIKQGLADLQAARASGALGASPALRKALMGQLNHRNAEGAVTLLAALTPADPELAGELLKTAETGRQRARWRAVEALEQAQGEAQARPARLAALKADLKKGSCERRKKAAGALAKLGDASAIPALKRARNRGFLDNMCMDGELEAALKTLQTPPEPGSTR